MSLVRSKSAEPKNMSMSKKSKNQSHQTPSSALTLRIHSLEAYVPVAVVDFIKTRLLKEGDSTEENRSPTRQTRIYRSKGLPVTQHEPETVVMFADVSGFTTITEKMTSFGPYGLERLVDNLNNLFDLILNKIRGAGGDVMKFAGDAIEIYWPRSEDQDMQSLAYNAVKTAMRLQHIIEKEFSNIDFMPYNQEGIPDLPKQLRVKFGIGLGKLSVVHLGGSMDTLKRSCVEFIPVGQGIVDSHSCERAAQGGQVIITEKVYSYISKLPQFTTQLASSKGSSLYLVTEYDRTRRYRSTVTSGSSSEPGAIDDATDIITIEMAKRPSSKSYGDKTLNRSFMTNNWAKISKDLEQILISYLPTTVVPYLNQTSEAWLPEMRRVTTIFFKIHLSQDTLEAISLGDPKQSRLLQDTFKMIQETVFRYEGSINKMFFDKGSWNVLVVFGLSPFAHDDDARRGILCALAVVGLLDTHLARMMASENDLKLGKGEDASMHRKMKSFTHRVTCSAGITTGLAFCGVLGSTQKIRMAPKKTMRDIKVRSNQRLSQKHQRIGSKASRQSEMSFDMKYIIKREQKEYSVLGDCINLASRLMDLAFQKTGFLFYDDSTNLATPGISSNQYGNEKVKVKGKTTLVKIFQVAEKSPDKKRRHATGLIRQTETDRFNNVAEGNFRRMSIKRGNTSRPIPKPGRTSVFSIRSSFNMLTQRRSVKSKRETAKGPPLLLDPNFKLPAMRKMPQKVARRGSLAIMRRGKQSISVQDMQRAENSLVNELHQAKAQPKRRQTMLLGVKGAGQSRQPRNYILKSGSSRKKTPSGDSLYAVHEKLKKIRSDFNNLVKESPTEKLLAKVPPQASGSLRGGGGGKKKKRRMSIRKRNKSGAKSKRTTAPTEPITTKIVCVEGSVGAGKTHAIAQVFHSTESVKKNKVLMAACSPFTKSGTACGFSVWHTIFTNFKKAYSKQQSSDHSTDVLVSLALKKANITKHNAFLYLLNDILGTSFNYDPKLPFPRLRIDLDKVDSTEDMFDNMLKSQDYTFIEGMKINANTSESKRVEIAIGIVVSILSAVFAGLAQISVETLDSKDLIVILDDAQYMTPVSWLICIELAENWPKARILLVLGLRNILFHDPNERKKTRLLNSSFEMASIVPFSEEAQIKAKKRSNKEERRGGRRMNKGPTDQGFSKSKLGLIPKLRARVQALENAEVVPLTNLEQFIEPIIKHAYSLADEPLPKELIDFLSKKTAGNPLYITDALAKYEAENLISFKKIPFTRENGGTNNKRSETKKLVLEPGFSEKLREDALELPNSVESVCGMLIDSLSTTQQIALKVAAMVGNKFNRKDVRDAFPLENLKPELDEEWEALVGADVIEMIDDMPETPDTSRIMPQYSVHSTTFSEVDDETTYYKFHAEWVKESLVNRMLFKQKNALRGKIRQLKAVEIK